MKETTPPWPGLILAVFGAGSVIFVSGDFWLGLAVLVVWTASLYLSLPRPEGDVAPRDEEIIDPGKMRGSVAKIVKLEHAWRRLDGRNDDGFQVAPFPG